MVAGSEENKRWDFTVNSIQDQELITTEFEHGNLVPGILEVVWWQGWLLGGQLPPVTDNLGIKNQHKYIYISSWRTDERKCLHRTGTKREFSQQVFLEAQSIKCPSHEWREEKEWAGVSGYRWSHVGHASEHQLIPDWWRHNITRLRYHNNYWDQLWWDLQELIYGHHDWPDQS